jgi:citrate synthase
MAIGRFVRYLAHLLDTEPALDAAVADEPFANLIYRAVTGETTVDPARARLVQAMVVACVDHGVTPPSAQATVIAASVRATFEMAIASGIGAITDVHGGAGAKAAQFFGKCVDAAPEGNLEKGTDIVLKQYMKEGNRVQGMGHRIHTQDPRRDVLWNLSQSTGLAGDCVAISQLVSDLFQQLRGMSLPINVDGVIGAIVSDMGLRPDLAKALFVFGRVAGLSAHYFEEIASQSPMRRINFADAVYKGKPERPLP